jgi:uncharacterized DUF497 family protein
VAAFLELPSVETADSRQSMQLCPGSGMRGRFRPLNNQARLPRYRVLAVARILTRSFFAVAKNSNGYRLRSTEKRQERRGARPLVELAHGIEWQTALIIVDDRKDYGETRLQVLALIEGRLHVIVVTPRSDDLRVISLRKANKKEVERYG